MLASVLGVALKRGDDLVLLTIREGNGRNDRDLLFLVELLVQFSVLGANLLDVNETLVFSKDSQEVDCGIAERSSLSEGLVEQSHFFGTDTAILSEEAERLAMTIELLQVHHILVYVEEGVVLGGSGEENACIATLDRVLL